MKKGFTVVEVLVVIGIIAVLTVIVFPAINEIRKKNRDAERISDIAAIQLGLSLYKIQKGEYPTSIYNTEFSPKYVTADSLAGPSSPIEYEYVALKLNSSKCSFYHLGVKLELPSAQIDAADRFKTTIIGDPDMNGYSYCGDNTVGLAPGNNYYNVHP